MGGDPLTTRSNLIENKGTNLFSFDISFLDRRHVNGMVTADSLAEAEDRLRNHPDLKNVVGLQVESLKDMGVVEEIEKQLALRVDDMEAELPQTNDNNQTRKTLN